MPALTLHLFSLSISPEAFIQRLRQNQVEVVVTSRPQHVVIHPTALDKNALTSHPWDLLAVLRLPTDTNAIPSDLQAVVRDEYKILVGIPSKLLGSYAERDAKLKRETASIPLTGSLEKAQSQSRSSSQNLELSPDLLAFMDRLTKEHGDKPVTMLNLLHFNHPNGKQSYYQYGQAFIPVAGKRGGSAKLVGNVVKPAASIDSRGDHNRPEQDWWNEISIVHYPSIRHFCDMLAGDDYQAINERYRLSVSFLFPCPLIPPSCMLTKVRHFVIRFCYARRSGASIMQSYETNGIHVYTPVLYINLGRTASTPSRIFFPYKTQAEQGIMWMSNTPTASLPS